MLQLHQERLGAVSTVRVPTRRWVVLESLKPYTSSTMPTTDTAPKSLDRDNRYLRLRCDTGEQPCE